MPVTQQEQDQKVLNLFSNLSVEQAYALYNCLEQTIENMEADLDQAAQDYDREEDYLAHVAYLNELKGILDA